MICQTRKPKQQTFPISFHHPIGSVMSLLSQLLYESSIPELAKKQPAARGVKIFQPKRNQPRGEERRCVEDQTALGPGGGVLGGVVGGVPEASNGISKISQTARDLHEFWSVHEMEEHRRSLCVLRYYLFF